MKKYFGYFLLLMAFTSFSSVYAQQAPAVHLNHIAVYVKDLKSTTDFYKNIIGLEMIEEPFHDGRHTWFSIGDKSHLHLIQGAAAGLSFEKNSHLCFSIASVENFISILDKNNIEYENWPGEKKTITKRVDGVKQIYFKDPDGYWVEINDAKE